MPPAHAHDIAVVETIATVSMACTFRAQNTFQGQHQDKSGVIVNCFLYTAEKVLCRVAGVAQLALGMLR